MPDDLDYKPLIDVIVVSYGHAKFMSKLFLSLSKVAYPRDRWRLHIVINKEGDGTLTAVHNLMIELNSNLPKTLIHEPHANLGFAGGNNLAIQWSIKNAGEYVYLLNPDTEIIEQALDESIKVALSDSSIGTVQSLLLRGDNPQQINSKGNAIHFLGFGYCLGDHDPVETAPTQVTDITYASGAGVLIPLKVMQEIGLLEDALHSYHEDLDFGWRVMLAGLRNVLAPKSIVIHHYEFSRSIAKWEFMERNRLLVMLKNYSLPTIIVLLPAIIATEAAIWAFSAKGGWLKQKWRASVFFLKPSTWSYLFGARLRVKAVRRVPDYVIFKRMTWKVEYQELKSGWAERIANPFWKLLYASYSFVIRW